MFAVIKNNQIAQLIQPGQQLIIDQTDWGYNWHSYVDQAALGIKEVVETAEPDQRFYWVSSEIKMVGGVPTRVHTTTPKDLDQLKAQYIAETKYNANIALSQTDWMVIRKAERNIDIPSDTAAARAEILADCAEKEAAITAASTVEALMEALKPVVSLVSPSIDLGGASASGVI